MAARSLYCNRKSDWSYWNQDSGYFPVYLYMVFGCWSLKCKRHLLTPCFYCSSTFGLAVFVVLGISIPWRWVCLSSLNLVGNPSTRWFFDIAFCWTGQYRLVRPSWTPLSFKLKRFLRETNRTAAGKWPIRFPSRSPKVWSYKKPYFSFFISHV